MRMILFMLGIALIPVVAWIVLLLWLRHRLERTAAEMRHACVRQGETIMLGPASTNFRGSDFTYGRAKGNGVICVTDRRILFQKIFGEGTEIPLTNVTRLDVTNSFRGFSTGTGASHLVIHTRDGNRIGFLVKGAAQWKRSVEGLLGRWTGQRM
ncbi:MAG: hypothetical protein ACM3ON_01510 [Chloroflexota bacterium]